MDSFEKGLKGENVGLYELPQDRFDYALGKELRVTIIAYKSIIGYYKSLLKNSSFDPKRHPSEELLNILINSYSCYAELKENLIETPDRGEYFKKKLKHVDEDLERIIVDLINTIDDKLSGYF